MDEEKLSARIGRVFLWLRDKYRQTWEASRRPTTAEDVISPWGYGFIEKWYSEVGRIVVLGLEDPGTLEELRQHRRGELHGAPMERQRVIFTQIAMIQFLTRRLAFRYPSHKASVVAYSPNFSQQTVIGLKHLNITAIRHPHPDLINKYVLVVDLRTEQGPVIDSSNIDLILGAGGRSSPRAILKRCSTITPSGWRNLVPSVARHYYVHKHMELPSHPGPMREAEQVWSHEVRDSVRRSRGREAEKKQEEGKLDVNEDDQALKGDEQRAAELARNIMVLVIRKVKKRSSAGIWASYL